MQEMSDATAGWAREAEAEFFRTLNALGESAVRAGCGSPGLFPVGMVVLETTGAKSGLPRRVPLLATVLEGICSSEPRAAAGRTGFGTFAPRRASATGSPAASTGALPSSSPRARPDRQLKMLPPLVRAVAEGVLPAATVCGWQFVVISRERGTSA
jgi:hypothetical protein